MVADRRLHGDHAGHAAAQQRLREARRLSFCTPPWQVLRNTRAAAVRGGGLDQVGRRGGDGLALLVLELERPGPPWQERCSTW